MSGDIKGLPISKNELERRIQAIKLFMEEQNSLNDHLKAICAGSYASCEIGNVFLDEYIKLLSAYIGDENDWISWYALDTDFGRK